MPFDLRDALGETLRERHAAGLNTQQDDVARALGSLDDLVRDPRQGAADVGALEDRFARRVRAGASTASNGPSAGTSGYVCGRCAICRRFVTGPPFGAGTPTGTRAGTMRDATAGLTARSPSCRSAARAGSARSGTHHQGPPFPPLRTGLKARLSTSRYQH